MDSNASHNVVSFSITCNLQLKSYADMQIGCLSNAKRIYHNGLYPNANNLLISVCVCVCVRAVLNLTHLPLVPHIRVSESGQHRFRWWFVAYSAPYHYLNQCWIIVNWAPRNKLQLTFNQNSKHVIQENAYENIVCETAVIFFQGRWDNHTSVMPTNVRDWFH